MSETYIFKKPFDILSHGTNNLVQEIEIPAPTGRMQSLFSRLEAEYSKLIKTLQEDAQKLISVMSAEVIEAGIKANESSKKVEEKDINERIKDFLDKSKSSGFDLSLSYGILKDILCAKKGGAKLICDNNEFELQSGHWDDIPMSEIKNMLGFYIENFMDTSD